MERLTYYDGSSYTALSSKSECVQELGRLEDLQQQGRLIELPCKIGADVFVSPNNGKSFHKARLYGKNGNGSHLVMVCDETLTKEEKHLVSSPIGRLFYDWFYKIYTKEEAEQALSK